MMNEKGNPALAICNWDKYAKSRILIQEVLEVDSGKGKEDRKAMAFNIHIGRGAPMKRHVVWILASEGIEGNGTIEGAFGKKSTAKECANRSLNFPLKSWTNRSSSDLRAKAESVSGRMIGFILMNKRVELSRAQEIRSKGNPLRSVRWPVSPLFVLTSPHRLLESRKESLRFPTTCPEFWVVALMGGTQGGDANGGCAAVPWKRSDHPYDP